MYPLNQLKTLVSCGRDPARSLPFRRGFLLIPLILLCFALSPNAQAAPAPEIQLQRHPLVKQRQIMQELKTVTGRLQIHTPDPGSVAGILNTADGHNALDHALAASAGNSAFGGFALFDLTTGDFNTGCGVLALDLNNADENTAVGAAALLFNVTGTGATTGTQNAAVGTAALENNVGGANDGDGSFNDAVGAFSLFTNTTGASNNAVGNSALFFNVIASANTAIGDVALTNNDSTGAGLGNGNTAVGAGALFANTDGDSNDAVGFNALGSNTVGLFNNALGFDALADITTGAGNVAVGDSAGTGNTTGSFNIYIGAQTGTVPIEDETIRIGDTFSTACFIGGISGATVPGGLPVIVDATGHLGTVPADSPISMNQMLKQRQIVQELKTTTERQAAVIALQEGQIKALTAGLKQQADQIQKVSAQLEMVRPTPRVVENR
jgi:hypothetical protein